MTQKLDPGSKWLVFIAVSLGSLLPSLDFGSVNIALPTIADNFDEDILTAQWVILGYVVALSIFLLPAGRLADIHGRKQVYILGLGIFALASSLAGLSPNVWGIIGLKAASGIGTAMVMANGIAILATYFPPGERGKAVGSHMVVLASGTAMGPVIGGVLVEVFGWRSVFLVNLPIALAAIAVAAVVFDANRPSVQRTIDRRPGFDGLGAALSAGAVLLMLLGLGNGPRVGWGSPEIVGALAIGAGLTAVFILWERKATSPMLDLSIFKSRVFSFGSLAAFVSYVGAASVWFLMPFYLQGALGYSPGQAGAIMIANIGSLALSGSVSGWLSDRFGQSRFVTIGAALSCGGLFLLSRLSIDSSLSLVVAALALQGCGMGMFVSSNQSALLGATEPAKYGVASAFINLSRNLAQNTGVAVATAIVVTTMTSMGFESRLGPETQGSGAAGAFTEGLKLVYLVSAGLVASVVVLTALTPERGSRN